MEEVVNSDKIFSSVKYIFERSNVRYIRSPINIGRVRLFCSSYLTISFSDPEMKYHPIMRYLRKEGAEFNNFEVRVKEGEADRIDMFDIEETILNMIEQKDKMLFLYTADRYISLEIKVRLSQVYDELGILIVLLPQNEVNKLHEWAKRPSIDDCLCRLCDLCKKVMLKRIAKKPLDLSALDETERYRKIQMMAGQKIKTTEMKQKFIEAYEKAMCNITLACKIAGIKSRKTFYNWIGTDPDFKNALESTSKMRNDMVEDRLMAKVLKGDGPSVRFFLSRQHPEYRIKRVSVPPKREYDPWRKWESLPDEDDE